MREVFDGRESLIAIATASVMKNKRSTEREVFDLRESMIAITPSFPISLEYTSKSVSEVFEARHSAS